MSPLVAHAVFFRNHTCKTPRFHTEIILDWHSSKPNVLDLAFRGAAKSTLAEEAITVICALGQTRNCVILGESETRAAERLRAIKNHFEQNEWIAEALGVEPGDVWTETRATLSNGVMIQAYGRYQSLRGAKHLNRRPDLIFMDDLEDKESVATEEQRLKVRQWFASTVVPALTPDGRMRMAATPLHPEALAPTLAKAKHWFTRTYPIIYKDPETGEDKATWPEMYSVEWAEKRKTEMEAIGRGEDFVQEYMCQAVDPASQTFTEDMFRVVPRQRSWHATYAVYDPARTTNKSSATTGKVVASWIGRKLVVWECTARKWMPDEIVRDIFDTDERYSPVAIGFEENGLNEWALQPIRAEQVARGYTVPLRPLSAPKGKLDFIRGLQPYFKAGEVEFVTDMPELRAQLLGFPTGLIDAPNALAYMLRMKLGVPVYEGFSSENVRPDRPPSQRTPVYLALNTDGRVVTGALVQLVRGTLTVFADWIYEGDAGQALPDILEAARLEVAGAPPARASLQGSGAGSLQPVRPVAPLQHFQDYSTLALRAAAKRCRINLARGGDPARGREEIRTLSRRLVHDQPALCVHERARWTLRAFAGGYARDVDQADPQPGAYAVLMEGLESFMALTRHEGSLDSEPAYSYTSDGRRYISALAQR